MLYQIKCMHDICVTQQLMVEMIKYNQQGRLCLYNQGAIPLPFRVPSPLTPSRLFPYLRSVFPSPFSSHSCHEAPLISAGLGTARHRCKLPQTECMDGAFPASAYVLK